MRYLILLYILSSKIILGQNCKSFNTIDSLNSIIKFSDIQKSRTLFVDENTFNDFKRRAENSKFKENKIHICVTNITTNKSKNRYIVGTKLYIDTIDIRADYTFYLSKTAVGQIINSFKKSHITSNTDDNFLNEKIDLPYKIKKNKNSLFDTINNKLEREYISNKSKFIDEYIKNENKTDNSIYDQIVAAESINPTINYLDYKFLEISYDEILNRGYIALEISTENNAIMTNYVLYYKKVKDKFIHYCTSAYFNLETFLK